MRKEDKTYQLIEDFLNGNLKGSELEAFEKELQEDLELQQQVKIQKLASDLVIENRLLQVKEILHQQKNTSGNSFRKYITGAVAIAFLLTGIWFLTKEEKKTEPIVKETEVKTQSDPEIKSEIAREEKTTSEKVENTLSEIEPSGPIAESSGIVVEEDTISSSSGLDSILSPLTVKTDNFVEKELKEKKVETKVNEDPCKTVQITANISTNPSCAGEEEGAIMVSGIKGGNAPYKVSVFTEKDELKNIHLNLSAGVYNVVVKDAKGCSKNLGGIIVPERICPKDYSFNPFIGESWTIPSKSKEGKLEVYNNAGTLYFEKEIYAGAEEQWSGESSSGEIKTGYFIFVIKCKDGTQVQGSVTIVR